MKNLILTIAIICTQLISLYSQPVANFSADVTEACSSVVVHFTNNSSPTTGLTYSWDFGNGTTSSLFEPTVAYTQTGQYNVTLIVSDGTETNSLTKEKYINVYSAPIVNIGIIGDESGCAPHIIQFEDNTVPGDGAINNWYWDFGDGTISTEQNPEHTFSYQSNFEITLVTTDDNNCTGIGTYGNLISVFKPTSDFLADPLTSCRQDQTFNFFNNSTGIGDLTYHWDFGDGSISEEQHPSHNYNSNGEYTVELITYDEMMCTDTLIKDNYIKLSGVNADFSVNTNTLCINEELIITNLSEGATSYLWDLGDGTYSENKNLTHTYSHPGNYEITLTATHVLGCSDTHSLMITVEGVSADFHLSDEFSCEVPVTVHYINDSENAVSYEWHFGNGETSFETNPYVTYTKKGYYTDTLIAISTNGCKSKKIIEKSMTVLIPGAYFTPNVWSDPFGLKGCAPHTVDFENKSKYITEYDDISEHHWDFGDGSQSSEKSPSHTFYEIGKYPVTYYYVTSRGCVSTRFSAVAEVGSEQTADFFKTLPDTICASQAIQFFDDSQDSTLINEWYWRFGDSTYSMKQNPVHTYIDTGYMDVKLQAYYNGCGVAKEKKKFVYVKGPIVKVDYHVECDNPYEALLKSNAIDAEKVYWDFGDGSPIDSVNFNPNHIYSNNKTYTVNLTAFNKTNSCSYSSENTVIIKDIKARFEITDSIGCQNLSIKINSEKSQDNAYFFSDGQYGKYLWDFGDGTKLVTSDPLIKHIYTKKGKDTLKLIVQDIRGCKDSISSEIKIFKPEVDFKVDDLIGCMPMNVIFNNLTQTDTTIVSWEWNFGDNTSSNVLNPGHIYSDYGIFDVSLTAIDTLGCTGTIHKNNYIKALRPIPDFLTNDNTICLGDEINFSPLDTSEIASYFWNFGDGHSSIEAFPKHIYENAGSYPVSLTLIDEQGCDSTLILNDYINIQNNPTPYFSSSNVTSECYPLQVNFTDTTNNSDVIDWFWNFGDGETSSHLKNPIHIYTAPGAYDINLNVKTGNGCTGEILKQKYINIKGPYAEINVADTVCRNEETLFVADKQKDIFDLQWIFGDGNTSHEDTVYHSYDNIGYMRPVLLLKSDTFGTCDVYLSDSIYIPQLIPEISAVNDEFNGCIPFEFNPFNNSSDVNNWLWSFGDGTHSTGSNPQHTYLNPGKYNVKLIISNNFGCSDSSEKIIESFALPVVTTMNDTLICVGDDVQLNAYGAENYNWSPKLFLNDDYSNHPFSEPDSTIKYSVTGTDINGCSNNSNVTIAVQQIPTVNFRDTAVIIGEQVILDAYSDQILTYDWFPDDEPGCNNCPAITVSPLEPTTYGVTVTDINGCFSENYDVFIDIIKKYTIDVPSAFTPNGDGINDIVFVRGWGVKNLILFRIYNRYGEIIFESTDKDIGWDGTYKGKMQGVETYTYEAIVRTYENQILTKRGSIKLLR